MAMNSRTCSPFSQRARPAMHTLARVDASQAPALHDPPSTHAPRESSRGSGEGAPGAPRCDKGGRLEGVDEEGTRFESRLSPSRHSFDAQRPAPVDDGPPLCTWRTELHSIMRDLILVTPEQAPPSTLPMQEHGAPCHVSAPKSRSYRRRRSVWRSGAPRRRRLRSRCAWLLSRRCIIPIFL